MNENKPISVVKAEFIANITNLINETKLHPIILESIMKDLYLEVRDISQRQYEKELQEYKMSRQKTFQGDFEEQSKLNEVE